MGILSAFTRDALHGWVYIEAKEANYLAPALLAIPGVAHRRDGSIVAELVELSNRPLLLDMSLQGSTLPFSSGSWVRIKDGLYKGDLGLVRCVDSSDCELLSVMLVPRLHLTKSKKRKRGYRPNPALFDEAEIARIFGEGSVKVRNQFRVFRGRSFYQGLLETPFHPTRLSLETSHASPHELDPFRGCEYWTDAGHLLHPIRAGDRILVMAGPLQGCSGFVVEVNHDLATLRFRDESSVREVRQREVRKHFVQGDFVQVVEGPNRGAQGFVVDSNDVAVAIYSRTMTVVYASNKLAVPIEQEGREVGIFLIVSSAPIDMFCQVHANPLHLDWMDPSSFEIIDPPMLSDIRLNIPPSVSEVLRDDLYQAVNLPGDSEKLARELRNERIRMHTGDPYVQMEVQIIKGMDKGHQAVVKGSHFSVQGKTLVDVLTSTHAINTQNTYSIDSLREK